MRRPQDGVICFHASRECIAKLWHQQAKSQRGYRCMPMEQSTTLLKHVLQRHMPTVWQKSQQWIMRAKR